MATRLSIFAKIAIDFNEMLRPQFLLYELHSIEVEVLLEENKRVVVLIVNSQSGLEISQRLNPEILNNLMASVVEEL